MDEIQRLTKRIKKCSLDQHDKVSNLVGKLHNERETCIEKTELDLIFYGVG